MLRCDLGAETAGDAGKRSARPRMQRSVLAVGARNGDIFVFGHGLQMKLQRKLSTAVDLIYERRTVNSDVRREMAVTKSGAGFADRLAYARWVRQLDARGEETDAELAANAGVGAKWLSKWRDRHTAPSRMEELQPLATYLGADVVWLWSGAGEPPRPDLWGPWIKARLNTRRRNPSSARRPKRVNE